MTKNKLLALALAGAMLTGQSLYACTGIAFKTEDGTAIAGRSIEWGYYDLNSKLVIMPRGADFQSYTSEGKKNGLKWKGKYGFTGVALVYEDFIGEGVNEAGLNAGMFYFSGYGSLSKYNPKKASKSLADMYLVSWILSNFSTVEEVKANLPKVTIVPIGYEKDGQPLPTAHWRVTDAKGGNIVIEITDGGKVNIYDNKAGVFTNSPEFPWHITNLNNYVNLETGTAKNRKVGDIELKSLGGTSSLLGLPGDYTPPSRFVRAFFALHSAPKAKTAAAGIKQGFQILKAFTIPIGEEFAPGQEAPNIPSATQWTAFSNLSGKEFYYTTMYNPTIRKIDLNKIDFSTVKKYVLPLETKTDPGFQEIYFN